MKTQFYPIDIVYKTLANKASILLFGRTTKGEQICVFDDSFTPYFYAIPEKGKEEQLKDKINKIEIVRIYFRDKKIIPTFLHPCLAEKVTIEEEHKQNFGDKILMQL